LAGIKVWVLGLRVLQSDLFSVSVGYCVHASLGVFIAVLCSVCLMYDRGIWDSKYWYSDEGKNERVEHVPKKDVELKPKLYA